MWFIGEIRKFIQYHDNIFVRRWNVFFHWTLLPYPLSSPLHLHSLLNFPPIYYFFCKLFVAHRMNCSQLHFNDYFGSYKYDYGMTLVNCQNKRSHTSIGSWATIKSDNKLCCNNVEPFVIHNSLNNCLLTYKHPSQSQPKLRGSILTWGFNSRNHGFGIYS